MLLINTDHAVAGAVQRSRVQGMIYAMTPTTWGEYLLKMEKLRGQADVQVGDMVLTSAMGEIYPSGLPIGRVIEVASVPGSCRTFRAIIKPFADFHNINYVLVVRSRK